MVICIVSMWIFFKNYKSEAEAAAGAVLLLLTWETTLSDHVWGQPWWDFASVARYDMAGMLGTALFVSLLERATTTHTQESWKWAGLVGGLSLLSHATCVATQLAAVCWVLVFHRRYWLRFVFWQFLGMIPLFLWLVSSGEAFPQVLAQLDRSRMLVPGAVSEWMRWSPLWKAPSLGTTAFVFVPVLSLFFIPRRPAGAITVSAWLLTSALDGTSGGNYALVYMPLVVVSLHDLIENKKQRRLHFIVLGILIITGLWKLVDRAPTVSFDKEAARAALTQALPAAPRLLIELRYWPLVPDIEAVTPYFVMQWERRPESEETLATRLTAWCPSHVLRGPGDWPFFMVREGWGGPSLQRWLDEHVERWEPVEMPPPLGEVMVGVVREGHCTPGAPTVRGRSKGERHR